ncbi:NAD(P)(+) transhydrogenase (Re/Si-specific) subunit beta [Sulfobacillus sp. DSM 109850]|uniref:NAD(P) transhydrogenase subunit beta n=2 Tax=Sulfobacillus harzensis TaxID=2729629 RepID=A0A7Y0Q1U9_9FIRM|nr:NAD(P)(+) transhydrogenase (Re/Si-specific) subunit beta [Sulfobacillus harzensis]NMP21710.1 NAD(P)(+) transhydrogenase (Re/Si-specific) subunit beta [Sulfobacillus harzensis]
MISATLFVLGVRFLGSPASARKGNRFLAIGMLVALATTVTFAPRYDHWVFVVLVVLAGSAIGIISARKVRMTAMPQMVALFNGLGGGAAALVAAAGWPGSTGAASGLALLTMILGSLSFGGSIIAFLKLQEWLHVAQRLAFGLRISGLLVLAAAVAGAIFMGTAPSPGLGGAIALMGAAAVSGALLTLPIGGADMPVVISLLNALTGLSAAATGFVLHNQLLIIAGTLVGASGTILTQQMSRAMHRSLTNVIWSGQAAAQQAGSVDGTVQSITPDDVAMLLRYAKKVVIVPGYGLAVARAQLEVKQVTDLLQGFGVEVLFGIHPVAGRMPGHMNVLLAEADVPYDQLWEMDRINPRFRDTNVVLVVGANDVTNPAARTAAGSPLYGMPILNVDEAQNVVVLKRSMGRGFAGVDNPLYVHPKTRMLFGDAKHSLSALVRELETIA